MIDYGNDDFMTDDNSRLNIHFKKLDIRYEFCMRDGAHNWLFWHTGLPTGLKFTMESFHQL